MRQFNAKAGFDKNDDKLPKRIFKQFDEVRQQAICLTRRILKMLYYNIMKIVDGMLRQGTYYRDFRKAFA